MINAQQAKQLYEESGVEVRRYLDIEIEPQVIKAAKEGKRKVVIHVGSIEVWNDLKLNSVHQGVISGLKELGYDAFFGTYGESYVPRGLADAVGDGPQYLNYGFIISW